MSPEEAKASMGLATFLQDQMMPQGQPQTPEGQQTPEMGQESQVNPQELIQQVSDVVDQKLTEFKEELLTALEEDEDGDQEAETDKETEERPE